MTVGAGGRFELKRSLRIAAMTASAVLAVSSAEARDRAAFINGTYAAGDGCQKLAALESGTARTIETVPDTLTADGIKTWEGGCEFAKTFEHEQGRVWISIMYCSVAATLAPATHVFVKDSETDSFEVAMQGQDTPEVYVRCDTDKNKKKDN
jgi:hypothetical protein